MEWHPPLLCLSYLRQAYEIYHLVFKSSLSVLKKQRKKNVLPEDAADSKPLTVLINQSEGGQKRPKRFY